MPKQAKSRGGCSGWLIAARPKTLVVSAAPVCVGGALAGADDVFHAGAWLCALACALLLQIGANLVNDYVDGMRGVDTARRIGPVRATQAGLLSPEQVRLGFIIAFAGAALLGLYLAARGGWPFLALGVLAIGSGILYTAGPYPLAEIGLAELFVLFFFGPVAVAGTYTVQAPRFNSQAVVVGLAFGLLAVGLLTANNLRDREQDAQAGKRTLAVRFGDHFARWQYTLAMLLPAFVPLFLFAWAEEKYPFVFLAIVGHALALMPVLTVWRARKPREFVPVLPATAAIIACAGVAWCAGFLL
ncbi:MAG: 1,4-dihydroxy-2-naphthoate polyprenyltransferase [Myxococcota bacterium]